MGKFNYTTNITGHRSTSVRRAIYRRSSPKDCCQRPQYRMGKPTPAPTRPPTPAPTPPTPQKIMVKQSYRKCFSYNNYYKSINTSLDQAKAMCKNDNSCNCINAGEWEPNEYAFYTSASLEIDEGNDFNTWIYTFPPKWKETTTKNYQCKNHENETAMIVGGDINRAIEWCKNNTILGSDASCKCLKIFQDEKNPDLDGWETFSDYTLAKSNSSNIQVYIYTSDPIPVPISAPIIETSDNLYSKPKILCLHGGGQTMLSLRVLLTDLINELSEFEFVFAETPEENYVWIRDPPGGKDDPTTDTNWASNSINYLDELVSNKGPFYGILGYSQGVAMALVYLAHLQETNKDKELSFKKVILFNGYLPTTHQGLVSSINNLVIDAPILKIVGKKDYAFYELGKILYNQLDINNTIELIEDELLGHYPSASEYSSFEDTVHFLKN